MCIALHPFLIGVPHRIRYLDRALRYVASHGQVWFATGHEIIAPIASRSRVRDRSVHLENREDRHAAASRT